MRLRWMKVFTRHGVERIIRYAFEFARNQGRKKVTLGDKATRSAWWSALNLQRVAALTPKSKQTIFVDVLARISTSPRTF